MLTDTIGACIQTLQKKQDIQKRKQADDILQAALANLNNASTSIQETLECMVLMQEKQIVAGPILKAETRDELLDSIDECGKGADEGTLSTETVKTFETRAKAARVELETAWQQNAPSYSEGQKGYLSMIAGLTDDPKAAKELVASIEKSTKDGPSKKNINALVSYVSEAKKKTASFALDPEIEVFLKKILAQKATVLDLVPGVMAWLKNRGLQAKLKIFF